ncbi:MAG TPA: NusG domain II-containing protein [Candidatus Fermentibacter sp.]|nr:NusG domain II-containing protein [Candidatus Fermentibacter sp.]
MSASSREWPLFRPADLVLYAFLAALTVALTGGGAGGASRLMVHSPCGESSFDLGRDTSFTVEGRLGPLAVEISGGRARIVSSPCPGRQCVDAGWVTEAGECTACMPSEVWICVEGGSGEAPDAVTH